MYDIEMYGEELLNFWVVEKNIESLNPLSDTKFFKLIDFLSTHEVCIMLREKRILVDDDFNERCETHKKNIEENLFARLNHRRKDACMVYTYYKKIIDSRESFQLNYFVADEETPLPKRCPTLNISQKNKVDSSNKEIIEEEISNIIKFCDFLERKSS